MNVRLSPLIGTIVTVVLISGCGTLNEVKARKNWERAKTADQISEYQSFLNRHPTSQYADSAQKALEQHAWRNAQAVDSVESYRSFIDSFPSSEQIDMALARHSELKAQVIRAVKTVKVKIDCWEHAGSSKIERAVKELVQKQGREVSADGVASDATLSIEIRGSATTAKFFATGYGQIDLYNSASIYGTIQLDVAKVGSISSESFRGETSEFKGPGRVGITMREEVSIPIGTSQVEFVQAKIAKLVEDRRKPAIVDVDEAMSRSGFFQKLTKVISELGN